MGSPPLPIPIELVTDDATLQQLASATPDQINKTIATPLAKKHGRGNLPKHAKHASPKTVATQPAIVGSEKLGAAAKAGGRAHHR